MKTGAANPWIHGTGGPASSGGRGNGAERITRLSDRASAMNRWRRRDDRRRSASTAVVPIPKGESASPRRRWSPCEGQETD